MDGRPPVALDEVEEAVALGEECEKACRRVARALTLRAGAAGRTLSGT